MAGGDPSFIPVGWAEHPTGKGHTPWLGRTKAAARPASPSRNTTRRSKVRRRRRSIKQRSRFARGSRERQADRPRLRWHLGVRGWLLFAVLAVALPKHALREVVAPTVPGGVAGSRFRAGLGRRSRPSCLIPSGSSPQTSRVHLCSLVRCLAVLSRDGVRFARPRCTHRPPGFATDVPA